MPRAKIKQDGLLDSWGRRNRKYPDRKCGECGKLFRPLRASSKYCSRKCVCANNGGHNKKDESWWINSRGYVEGRIWLDDETQLRVKQHRFVMEGVIGRPLFPDEDVHHIDGNKTNNAPVNLALISHGDHSRMNNSRRTYKKGYKLNLSEGERKNRSLRAIAMRLSQKGRTAIAKVIGLKK